MTVIATNCSPVMFLEREIMIDYYDGEWRPVTDHSFKALEKLRSRGFELGSDRYGRLMARWPIAPAAPLTFTGIPLEYWREEVRLMCAVSLARLRRMCESRGASYDATIAGLR